MTDQEKEVKTPENETGNEAEERHEDQRDKFKDTTEKLWGSTRQAFSTATFKATREK